VLKEALHQPTMVMAERLRVVETIHLNVNKTRKNVIFQYLQSHLPVDLPRDEQLPNTNVEICVNSVQRGLAALMSRYKKKPSTPPKEILHYPAARLQVSLNEFETTVSRD
jgi:hypothetical protein